jgi:hypothetical protein
MLAETEQK